MRLLDPRLMVPPIAGEDASTARPFAAQPPPPPTAARRRTDLLPTFPSLRDAAKGAGSPRHRSPGRALSLGRLDQLARPRPQPPRPPSLAPLHERSRERRMTPARTMSKSMSHLGSPADGALDRLSSSSSRSSVALGPPRPERVKLHGAGRSSSSAEAAPPFAPRQLCITQPVVKDKHTHTSNFITHHNGFFFPSVFTY